MLIPEHIQQIPWYADQIKARALLNRPTKLMLRNGSISACAAVANDHGNSG
jgi:hypothetical protein